jgi:ankyrin repeat protein
MMNHLQVRQVLLSFIMVATLSSCVEDKTLGWESSLCSPVRSAAVTIVSDMLDGGKDPNGYCTYEYGGNYYISRAKISRPLLITAIEGNNREIVRLLIRAGADVNAPYSLPDKKDTSMLRPLALSIIRGDLPTAKLLLKKGANPDGNGSIVPLSYALLQKRLDLLNLLLQSGANPTAAIPIETTLFHRLVESEYSFFKPAAKAMLDKGADINIQDRYGQTPLHNLVKQCEFAEVVLKAKFLLEHGANVNIRAKNGNTPLFDAGMESRKYAPELFRFLISKGSDVKIKGINNLTVLHQLVTNVNPESLKLMQQVIDLDSNVNEQDKNGNTPLHYLAQYSYYSPIPKATLLLKSGAKSDIKNREFQTPLELAKEKNNIEMVQLLSKSP